MYIRSYTGIGIDHVTTQSQSRLRTAFPEGMDIVFQIGDLVCKLSKHRNSKSHLAVYCYILKYSVDYGHKYFFENIFIRENL